MSNRTGRRFVLSLMAGAAFTAVIFAQSSTVPVDATPNSGGRAPGKTPALEAASVSLVPSSKRGPVSRVRTGIDLSRTHRLPGTLHPRTRESLDLGPYGEAKRIGQVTLAFKQTPEQRADLQQLLKAQADRTSPEFRRWLTPDAYAARFGATQDDIDKVAAWLHSQGLEHVKQARGRDYVTFEGSTERIENALQTSIHRYMFAGKEHYANAVEIAIPEAFREIIGGVFGLNDLTFTKQLRPNYTLSNGSHALAPDDIANIYNVAALYPYGLDGTGQTLVVVGQSDILIDDIRAFQSTFNLPQNDPYTILVGDTYPGVNDDVSEAHLDLQWTSAVARNATIIYIYGKNVIDAVYFAIDNNVSPVLSMSYGGCELGLSGDSVDAYRQLALKANAFGITWLASSGDSGAAGCEYDQSKARATTGLSVNVPASIPEVTAVGGTTFAENGESYWSSRNTDSFGSAYGYIPEVAWNDFPDIGFSSTGGGQSIWYGKPSWQAGAGVPNDNVRDLPDLSFSSSSGHDPYIIVLGGKIHYIGGTSAATPVFAGIVTILNQYLTATGDISSPGLGNINPVLYRLTQNGKSPFHDVVGGSNVVRCVPGTPNCGSGGLMGFVAGEGYDPVAGVGSADALSLAANFTTGWSFPKIAVTKFTTDTSALPGSKINVSATITNIGQADAGAFKLTFYAVGDGSTNLGYCTFTTLAVGSTKNCAGTLTVPSDLTPGIYRVLAIADSENQIVQLDNSLNFRYADSGPVTFGRPCSYALSSAGTEFGAAGGAGAFNLSASSGCAWSVSSSASWISITSATSGSGSAVISYKVAANSGAARNGTVRAATETFSISQNSNASINLQMTNDLIYPVDVSVNGNVVGTVAASASKTFTFSAPASMQVSFELVRPTLSGRPLGEEMAGIWSAVSNPSGAYNYVVTNQIGSQFYFVPLVTNSTSAPLLMEVNGGLESEYRCDCVVPVRGTNVAFGYFRLFTDSNVRAFADGSGYTGSYHYFESIPPRATAQTGVVRLTF